MFKREYEMKGIITKGLTAACLTAGLTAGGGCDVYRNLVDPCYPERYTYEARQEVRAAFGPQVHNGHVLDQTVWNYHFEPGTDKLTPGGMAHLGYLARRRPSPDCIVFLQTAQDVSYDPAAPEKFADARTKLDNGRIKAVQNYLNAQTAGRGVSFDVAVHDPAETGLAASSVGVSITKMNTGFQGNLPATAGAGASSVSGGGGAGGGGAGGGTSGGGSGR